jgi:RNA polymerase sigma factor FliA
VTAGQKPFLERQSSDEEALWSEFKDDGSTKAREQLFRNYVPLAKRLAARFMRNDVSTRIEFEEFFQLACTGLLEAIDHYKPELGVPFRYFGNRRINGSILTGIARYSEVNQQISARSSIVRERMASVKSHQTAPSELAAALDFLGEIAAELALGIMLEDSHLYSVEGRDRAPNAYETLAWKQAVQLVQAQLEQLPPRDRDLIRMHYVEGINFEQIAALFGVTKGRVSQLHKSAIALLRKRLFNTDRYRIKS